MAIPKWPGNIVDGEQIYAYEMNIRARPIYDNLNPASTNGEGLTGVNISESTQLSPTKFDKTAVVIGLSKPQTVTSDIKFVGVPRYKINYLTGVGDATPDVTNINVIVLDRSTSVNITSFDYGVFPVNEGHPLFIKTKAESIVNTELTCEVTNPYGSGNGSGIWVKGGLAALSVEAGLFFHFVKLDPTSENDDRWIQIASIP